MMATKNEKVGIVNKDQQPEKKKTITSEIDKRDKNQEGDGEAGVDPQVEQLNHARTRYFSKGACKGQK
jgi:hypothetical protein